MHISMLLNWKLKLRFHGFLALECVNNDYVEVYLEI